MVSIVKIKQKHQNHKINSIFKNNKKILHKNQNIFINYKSNKMITS